MSTRASEHYAPQEWSAYLDGEQPAARRDAMREHLRDCPSCAAILRSFEAVQSGAEQLAQQPAPDQPQLRTRLVAVGAAMIEQNRSRQRWWLWLGAFLITVILASLAAALWHGMMQPRVAKTAVVASKVQVTLDRVLITRYFVEPPSLEYDLTIHNSDTRPLEVIRVIVSDPLGEKECPVASALRVEPGQTFQRVFKRPVSEDAQLRPGSYRILLETSDGRLVAEKLVP
ncbi:MAG: zf-HC2 domain-containing protein [Verrucomicrobia bacterium]|nr:zf-HC2 domain-containing protein [Verrucomicrobiota bacterium]